jgi:hypothetical protein
MVVLPYCCAVLQFEGHHIRVDRAAKPTTAAAASKDAGNDAAGDDAGSSQGVQLYEPSRSVFVGNVEFTVSTVTGGGGGRSVLVIKGSAVEAA